MFVKSAFPSYRLDTAVPPNIRRGGAVYPLSIMRLKIAVAATAVARRVNVMSAAPRAHDYTVRTKARALWITVPSCARVSTQQEHEGTAQ
eukprot:6190657-Pleurochrysis_carterae.AAC.1